MLRLEEAFRAKGLGLPKHRVGSTSIQLFNALLATGEFLSVYSATTLKLSGKRLGLKVVPVDLPIRPGPIGIVTVKNRMVPPVAQRFIDCAREVAKPLRMQGR